MNFLSLVEFETNFDKSVLLEIILFLAIKEYILRSEFKSLTS